MATKVSKNLITSVDPSQLTTTGATAGQVLTYNASTTTWVASAAPGSAGGSITSGTAVNATGTSIDLTGIPSYARRVTVVFNAVSTNGTTSIQIQIGSGSVDTTGYKSLRVDGTFSSTTGILATAGTTTASTYTGTCVLTLVGTNTWSGTSFLLRDDNTVCFHSIGYKTIVSSLDRVRVTTFGGTDQFDAGTVNIMWE